MNKSVIGDVMSLSTAVHDLLQGMAASPVKSHHTRVFKTVQGLLARIDSIVDGEVTAEIKELLKDSPRPAQTVSQEPSPLTHADVLEMGIGALGLPPRLHSPLVKAGISKIRDMADLTIEQLSDLDGIGPMGAEKVTAALTKLGFQLAQ